MVTISQIQKGFVQFIDMQLAVAFDGWQKAVVIGGATLLAHNLPNLINTYSSNPMVAALGVYHPEKGEVDIDALYNAFVPQMGKEKLPISIPKIGTIKIGKDEIDLIVKYIKEA